MRILITWGSKRGGTAGIAEILGEALRGRGFEVVLLPAGEVEDLEEFDAAIVGGALYANRWHRDARRFIRRHVMQLRRIPVWFFSSGPLDDSADSGEIAPTGQVGVLMERVGALGHVTFGGRLEPDAKGFVARSMARTHSGDWRNPERVRGWADELARKLPTARPGHALTQPARSLRRVLAYGFVGWAVAGLLRGGLWRIAGAGAAMAVNVFATPVIFAVVAWTYFRRRGAREPLPTAAWFAGTVAVLDVVVAELANRLAMLSSVVGFWLPLALVFLVTWIVGGLRSTMPWPGDHRGPNEHRAPS